MAVSISARIKAVRKALGLSQRAFCHRAAWNGDPLPARIPGEKDRHDLSGAGAVIRSATKYRQRVF